MSVETVTVTGPSAHAGPWPETCPRRQNPTIRQATVLIQAKRKSMFGSVFAYWATCLAVQRFVHRRPRLAGARAALRGLTEI